MTTVETTPAIRLMSVTKRFGAETALDDVSFEVPRGVVFALLGANGAGKTTSIRVLLGLTAPDAGRAEVLGFDSVTDGLRIRQRVGCVAERPTLYEWMSVDEIGWFTAGFYDSDYLPRYRQLATRFDLPATRKIKDLSKGMRAKVALALALGNDPDLLVVGAGEMFAWSALFSLLIRHPLWAAVWGVTVPSACLGFVYPAFIPHESSGELFDSHVSYLPARAVVVLFGPCYRCPR